VTEFGMDVVDAIGSITDQQRVVRSLVAPRVTQQAETVPGDIIHDESV
jgi:hypothetical protein